ncbi:fungal-specific transcription factor domain-containing protein [Aspergillus avenaceus]|uniref:Fungal-specific transcription factor domain-containing protein n=1 Tax=Aspergillus avenaceus TaxID=36643 RepID=A0A5N6U3H9_ASPAV|nr:fungal-specific transcription factor domain-containing protein [Aspergillus avenaceus]
MPKAGRATPGPHELRACTECRCSGSSPCTYCARSRKTCVFGPALSRTPLTRKINPDLDIEAPLNRTDDNLEGDSTGPFKSSNGIDSEIESATLPGDRFEWREASLTSPSGPQRSPLDGMASLPSERTESGYLDSSGTAILRTISDLIPANNGSRADQQEDISPTNANQTGSPALLINFANAAALDGLIDAYFMWYTLEGSEVEQSVYYTAARSRMSMRMLESGTLLSVQVFLLMGNYLQKRDRPNTGYNFSGIAYRMALGLGLYREPPGGATSDTLHNGRRRVVWWIIYCFDSGLSLTTGRPLTVSDSFIETRLPRNIDDADCMLESHLPPPVEHPTVYSAIIAQARLASIGNAVFSQLISASNKTPWDLRISRSIDYQFKAWRLSLPAYFTAQDVPNWFRGPRTIIIWKEQNLRMMLWWGSQQRCNLPSDKQEAQSLCHFTAIETIQEITNFSHDNPDALHTGLSWYATYFLFQATIVLSIHHLQSPQPLGTDSIEVAQELWHSSISRSRECLASLSNHNKAATRCLAVLDRIRNQSQLERAASTELANLQTDFSHLHTIPEERPAPLAVDPTLQMFFEDSTWDNDIFEGLNGFPGTGELDTF